MIPTNLLDDPEVGGFLTDLKDHGYTHNDFNTNGVHLPATDEDALRLGVSKHSGSHGIYDEFVKERLKEVKRDYDNKISMGERSLLDFEEFELVRTTHHPMIYELGESDLFETQARLRKLRDRERTLSREKRREARGKGAARGGSFPGTADHPKKRKMVFTAALKRINKEIKRLRQLEARAENIEAARRALAMHRAAKFRHHPGAEQTEGDDFRALPSRRRRSVVPPSRVGSISQHTKKRQAVRDARGG